LKRVLIISYYWPPSGGSGVQRWVKFAKYLPAEGWQPVIYTPANPELTAIDESLVEEIPVEAEVIKTNILEPYEFYRRLKGIKASTEAQVNPINSQKKSIGEKLSLAIRGNLFIPDPRCLWIRPSVRFLKTYLKGHPVDMIVSTGPPHSMHLIAREVSKACRVPWIADFRDPWTKIFYFKHLSLSNWAKRRHQELERRVLDDATAAVAVSPLVRDEFVQMTKTPVYLITNGFDACDKPEGGCGDKEHFNVTHTGLFAADGNPDMLWKVLAKLADEDKQFASMLNIRLCGKTDSQIIKSISQAGLADKLVNLGYQPHKNAVKEQYDASILLLPLRKEPEYRAVLPGKLFEYLACGRPLLGIGQTDGAMARIMDDSARGKTVEWEDAPSMESFIRKCWEAFKEGRDIYTGEDISCYSRQKLAQRYAELMNELTSK